MDRTVGTDAARRERLATKRENCGVNCNPNIVAPERDFSAHAGYLPFRRACRRSTPEDRTDTAVTSASVAS